MIVLRAALVVATAVICGCSSPAPEVTSAAAPAATQAAASTQRMIPVRLLTHCGIRVAILEGRTWVAVDEKPEPLDLPREDGRIVVDGYTEGMITFIGLDRIRFDVNDPYAESLPGGVEFVPLPAAAQPPIPCD